jgi:outer membrane protein assembly factor BamB
MGLPRIRAKRTCPAAVVLLAAGTTLATASPAAAATGADWPAYLDNTGHTSYNAAELSITAANAATLTRKWQVSGGVLSSPVVAGGAVFIGTDKGYFEKINATTGAVQAKHFIGRTPKLTCSANGVVSTATVNGGNVYVAGPDGYLYAFSTSNLSLVWRSVIAIPSSTVSNYFNWSSPTIQGGRIYVGISSHCDNPLVRGGEIAFNQTTGARIHTFYTVPSGKTGGSIWSSAAVDSVGNVYLTTGNAPGKTNSTYTESIIKLSPGLKSVLGIWQLPAAEETPDADFGGSPTLFGNDVGACDKNGIFYALNASTMALDWEHRVSAPASGSLQCIAAAAYNGSDLFVAGNAATIGGTAFDGVVQELTPTGSLVWQTGLPNAVEGSASLDGAGVLAAGTFQYPQGQGPNATYLFDAATGTILRTLDSGTADFGQTVFANGLMFTANSSGIQAWGP